jgi:hypothetical protein
MPVGHAKTAESVGCICFDDHHQFIISGMLIMIINLLDS